jgi:HlyD family secretion protein
VTTTQKGSRARRRRVPIWPIAILLVALAGGAWYVLGQRNAAQTAATAADTLDTTTAQRGTFRVAVNGPGTLAAARTLDVKADVNGTVTALPTVGERVTRGQLIARLDPAPFQRVVDNDALALQKARAQLVSLQSSSVATRASQAQSVTNATTTLQNAQRDLETARATLASNRTLYAAGGISAQELQTSQDAFERAQAAVNGARAGLQAAQSASTSNTSTSAQDLKNAQIAVSQAELTLESARDDLAKTKVYAPFTGLVSAVGGQVGASSSGVTLVSLVDDTSVDLPVQIDETQIAQVKPGQRAEVTLDALPSQTFEGKVVSVAPVAQVVQNIPVFQVTVRIANPEGALKPGMSAEADVISQEVPNAITVPKRAIQTNRNRAYVNVLGADGKTTELRRVRTGPDDGTNVVITSGLEPNETIVLPARQTSTTTTGTNRNRGVGFGIPLGGGR